MGTAQNVDLAELAIAAVVGRVLWMVAAGSAHDKIKGRAIERANGLVPDHLRVRCSWASAIEVVVERLRSAIGIASRARGVKVQLDDVALDGCQWRR